MKIRVLSMVIAICIVVSMFIAVPASAATSGTCGENVTWTLDSEGTLTISGTGAMFDYSATDESPFCYVRNIKNVIIKHGVTSIGKYAFYRCGNLTSVTIPNSVKSIGVYAFRDCDALISVVIPNSVTSIDDYAFSGCSALTSVTILKSTTSIGDYAFRGCDALTDIYYSGTKKEWERISSGEKNKVLKNAKVHFGTDQDMSDSDKGGRCGENVTWTLDSEGTLTISGTGKMFNYSYDTSPFYANAKIKNVIMKYGVTSIGTYAFYKCSSLTEVTILNSATSIGDYAFSDCDALTDIYYSGTEKEWANITLGIENEALKNAKVHFGIDQDKSAYVESGTCGENLMWTVDSRGTLTISGTGAMFDYSYYKSPLGINKKIKNVIIKHGVTSIGNSAFHSRDDLVSVTIPATVTSIGDAAFLGCSALTTVTIPNSVTSIGDYAFRYCDSLASVTIPDSVTSVGERAFDGCSSLTSVYITDIAAWCNIEFDYYSNPLSNGANLYINGQPATDIIIPDSVKSIGSYAFYHCNNLASVKIGKSVTRIGESAFRGCPALTSVTIPSSVTSIEYYAFRGCSGLTDVYYNGTEKEWANITLGIENEALKNAKIHFDTAQNVSDDVTRGTCGKSVTWTLDSEGTLTISGTGTMFDYSHIIDESPFRSNRNIKNVIIEPGVKNIGSFVFYECGGLVSVTIPTTVTRIGDRAFDCCDSLTSVTIPNSVTTIEQGAFADCGSLTSVTIPYGVKTIGDWAFRFCDSLTEVKIPDSVTSLGTDVFALSNNLTTIDVSKNNSKYCSVDGVLFNKDRTTLICYPVGNAKQSYAIPDGVTSIIGWAFAGCDNLVSVTIPASVTSIGDYAFSSCDVLTDVYYSGTEKEWANITLGIENEALKNAKIHFAPAQNVSDGVTRGTCGENTTWTFDSEGTLTISGFGMMYGYPDYNKSPFYPYRKNIKKVIIQEGITNIGEYTFSDCAQMVSVTIPSSVTSIGVSAFSACSSLEAVDIPPSVTSIGSHAFSYCLGIKKVVIPDGVTGIGDRTFYHCDNLKTVTIPKSLTRIGDYAFEDCGVLTDVYYSGTERDWENISIGGYNKDLTGSVIHCTQNEVRVNVNGNFVSFDQAPVIENGRTLVPLRAIFEALGAGVSWEQNTQTVFAKRGDVRISLVIGSAVMNVNDVAKILDVPAKIINGRTLVPVRAISEAFGCGVSWDGDTRTVTITE